MDLELQEFEKVVLAKKGRITHISMANIKKLGYTVARAHCSRTHNVFRRVEGNVGRKHGMTYSATLHFCGSLGKRPHAGLAVVITIR